jgi:wyosine [tRNA(Phe)-imidazoG37] synthetase (radical SAM superfamily)
MYNKQNFEGNSRKGNVTLFLQREKPLWENYIWNCKNKVVYGPVQSRRLGKSLGINLFPSEFNICTFDCIYCDCGRTQIYPHDFISVEKIKDELISSFHQHALNKTPINYITFAGNGEPTYYPYFSQIIDFVLELRDKYLPHKPLAIFSNGTMLFKREIVKSIAKLDERVFKIDAANEKTFRLINRPLNNVSLKCIIDELANLEGIKISSAVMCSGIKNFDSLKTMQYIEMLKKVKPLEVHLYSIDYPTAYSKVRQVGISKMLELAEYITNNIYLEVKVLRAKKSWKEVTQ